MFKSKKKIFFILFSALILSFFALFALAKLEIQYPDVGGGLPEEKTNFTDYVKYIFNFSMIVAGVLAFGTLVFSGFKILTSPDQPSVISDARTKIISAFIGIVILLSSYLILTTLNPSLSIITIPDIETFSGVILTDDKGKQHYLSSDNMSLGFNPVSAKFLSPPIELTAIYDQNDDKKENTGADTTTGFSGNSIRFLWNRPGVYLYPKTGFQGYPRYFNSSASNLSLFNFNDMASSLKFNNKNDHKYSAVLFTDSNETGECDLIDQEEITNLSTGFYHPIKVGTLSSFKLFDTQNSQAGQVIFYDRIDCKGNKYVQPIEAGGMAYYRDLSLDYYFDGSYDGTKNSLDKNILSFYFDGNFGVVLTTGKNLTERCQLFLKPSNDNCFPSIKPEYIYDVAPEGQKVNSYIIFPLSN